MAFEEPESQETVPAIGNQESPAADWTYCALVEGRVNGSCPRCGVGFFLEQPDGPMLEDGLDLVPAGGVKMAPFATGILAAVLGSVVAGLFGAPSFVWIVIAAVLFPVLKPPTTYLLGLLSPSVGVPVFRQECGACGESFFLARGATVALTSPVLPGGGDRIFSPLALEEQRASGGLKNPQVRARAVKVLVVFAVGIGLLVGIAFLSVWLETPGLVEEFKAEARTASEQLKAPITAALEGFEPDEDKKPPEELFSLLMDLSYRDQQSETRRFRFIMVYLPSSDGSSLWRYRGDYQLLSQYDRLPYERTGGFRRTEIIEDHERAMAEALSGNQRLLEEANATSKGSFHALLRGETGDPVAILRLTRYGVRGLEREIR